MSSKKKAKRLRYLASLRLRRHRAKKLEALLLQEKMPEEIKPSKPRQKSKCKTPALNDYGRTGVVKQSKPKWERIREL